MKTAIFYIRKSTDEAKIQQNSLEYQKHELKRYAKDFDSVEYREASESGVKPLEYKGKSVSKGRCVFGEILLDIEKRLKNKEDITLFALEFSRLARNSSDFERLYKLRGLGLNIRTSVYTFPKFEREWEDTHFVYWSMEVMMAIQTARITKVGQNRGVKQSLRDGRWVFGKPPFGHKTGRKKGLPEIVPEQAESVRRIFSEFLVFNGGVEAFVKSKRIFLRDILHAPSSVDGVRKLLKNTFYIGEKEHEGEVYKMKFPCILSSSQEKIIFAEVQEKMQSKTIARKCFHNFYFSRKITCKCGNYLIGELQKGRIYYRCQNANCDMTSLREDRIFDSLSQFFKHFSISIVLKEKIQELIQSALDDFFVVDDELKKKIERKLKAKKEQKRSFLQMKSKNLISDEDFLEEVSILKNEIKEIQAEYSGDELYENLGYCGKLLELLRSGFISWEVLKRDKMLWLVDFLVSNLSIDTKKALDIALFEFILPENIVNSVNGSP